MSNIFLKVFKPDAALQPYISKIFVFECMNGIRKNDLELITPNGEIKLVIPYKNSIRSTTKKAVRVHKESSCIIIGLSTSSAQIECDDDYGNICVLFKPYGAYKFFNFPLIELSDQMVDISDIFDKTGKELQEKLAELHDINDKISLIQRFLCQQMTLFSRIDPLVEFAVDRIASEKGLLHIGDLSDEMGYSRRYINNRFKANVGLSPKDFSSIVRFQEIFKNLSSIEKNQYDFYYDQAHFIKHFKKFTGMTPGEYVAQSNKLRCLISI